MFNLAKFHALSTNLDLIVNATDYFNFTLVVDLRQIAAAINSFTVQVNKLFSCQLFAFQVAKRYTITADPKFSFFLRSVLLLSGA